MKQDNSENIYVFVVCGDEKHILTLHFSLKRLRKLTKYRIIVVTDSVRNKIPVEHDNITDIATPADFDNHQASIWLKTRLHTILPSGPLYCYLDSDVIALNQDCDKIFTYFKPPAIFGHDHCTTEQFSPYAVNCNCKENLDNSRTEFEKAVSEIVRLPAYPPNYNNNTLRSFFYLLQSIRNSPLMNIIPLVKMIIALTGIRLRIKGDIYINKREKCWEDRSGNFKYPLLWVYRKEIRQKTGYAFNLLKLSWHKSGQPSFKNHCNHLTEAISTKFGIRTENQGFRHWNGGVFLFNSSSVIFMETWHEFTMQVFGDKYWKTRDQGTLLATALKLQLTNHPVLPEEFNFIADYYKLEIKHFSNFPAYTLSKNNKLIKPAFIHIYHEFGNTGWDVWGGIEKLNKSGN